ncbi:helix-turn-helix domain-containing protein [Nonomuraea jabiensis]|uniref:helix-turn-helix domain-containing protein n=1 Tax=Nonomuraea jabiensis TaxID=882448 RepID=UPI003D7121E4
MPKLLFARAARDEKEERDVHRLAGARHAPGEWILCAPIVVAGWDGLCVSAIAARLDCRPERCPGSYTTSTPKGSMAWAIGPVLVRRPGLTESEHSRIIALIKTIPPGRPVSDSWLNGLAAAEEEDAPGVWTLDSLTAVAQAAGIDVHRSQSSDPGEGRVRWRRRRSWTTSKDPEFAIKKSDRGPL